MDKVTEKCLKRLKALKTEGLVVSAIVSILAIASLVFTVHIIVAVAKNQTMFGSNSSAESATTSSNDILMLVVFLILTLALFAVAIYNICFRNFERGDVRRKAISNGRIVELKTKGQSDNLMADIVDSEKETIVKIDSEKIKRNSAKLNPQKSADTDPAKKPADSPDSKKADK